MSAILFTLNSNRLYDFCVAPQKPNAPFYQHIMLGEATHPTHMEYGTHQLIHDFGTSETISGAPTIGWVHSICGMRLSNFKHVTHYIAGTVFNYIVHVNRATFKSPVDKLPLSFFVIVMNNNFCMTYTARSLTTIVRV